MGSRIWDSGFGGMGSGIQDMVYGIRDTGYGIRDMGYESPLLDSNEETLAGDLPDATDDSSRASTSLWDALDEWLPLKGRPAFRPPL